MSKAADREAAQSARDAEIAAEESRDLSRAAERGERTMAMLDRLYNELHAHGVLRCDRQEFRRHCFAACSDELYGNAAVDIPVLTDPRRI